MQNGATWNAISMSQKMYGSSLSFLSSEVAKLNMDGGIINNAADNEITIGELSGSKGTFNMESLKKDQITILTNTTPTNEESTNVIIQGVGLNEKIIALKAADTEKGVAGLQDLADTVDMSTVVDANGESAQYKEIHTDAGKVAGSFTARTDKDGNIRPDTVTEAVNESNAGTASMDEISLLAWRQEMNDMNKRLGELRDSTGEHGAWVRMTSGKLSHNDLHKHIYN